MLVTGTAQRDAWLRGTFPPIEQIRPDLWSVPVPIPDSPLRYTLTYVIAGASELLVVDPGWDAAVTWDALASGLGALGASPAQVTGIVVTHAHPDHHGLSARLREASGAWVAMHPAERDSLPARHWRGEESRRGDLAWLAACGLPATAAAELAASGASMRPVLGMPEPDRLLEDGGPGAGGGPAAAGGVDARAHAGASVPARGGRGPAPHRRPRAAAHHP